MSDSARATEPAKGLIRKFALDKAFFVLALSFVAYLYGVKSVGAQLFPYPTIRDAKVAWDAIGKLEPSKLPFNILGWETGRVVDQEIQTLSPRAGSENILIAGGFFQRLDLCPVHGCLAWIIDRQGRVLHTWSVDPGSIFKDLSGFAGEKRSPGMNIYVVGVALGKDGSLVTTFQARNLYPYQVGIAKFDVNGKMLWAKLDNSHHWPTIGADGRIYTPFLRALQTNSTIGETGVQTRCEDPMVKSEGVRVLSPDGAVLKEFFLPDLIKRADYPGLTYATRDGCDPFHVNGIALLNEAAAEKLGARAGDLLVSLREQSALVVMDQDRGDILQVIPGRAAGQHSPGVLADGSLVAFDNLGGPRALGGSRALRIDAAADKVETVFPRAGNPAATPFYSDEAGVLAVSPDSSRILLSSSKQGRIIEVDVKTGEPLWKLENVMDLGPYLKANNLKGENDATHVRFSTQGAYYVDDLGFLGKRTPPAT